MTLAELTKDNELFEYYQNAIKYAKPINAYKCKELGQMKWGLIKETQNQLSKPNYDLEQIFSDFTGIPKDEIPQLDSNAFFSQVIWIMEEMKILTEKESRLLSSELTPLQIQAGFEELAKFGYFATLDGLAFGRVWNHDDVLNQPYDRNFAKLILNKTQAEIDKKHNELLYPKIS